jgi:ribonuclease E
VTFLGNSPADAATPVSPSRPAPAPAPAPEQPTSEGSADTQPRRAGWWSRRFGNGE